MLHFAFVTAEFIEFKQGLKAPTIRCVLQLDNKGNGLSGKRAYLYTDPLKTCLVLGLEIYYSEREKSGRGFSYIVY